MMPNGLIAHFYGPVAGSCHDSFMLGESKLIQQLCALMPVGETVYTLYGNAACLQTTFLMGSFPDPAAGSDQAKWNTYMSKVQIVVEWGFNDVITSWCYLDCKASMKIFQAPIAQYYIIGIFLTNCRNCLYGSQTLSCFKATTLSLQQYLNLTDNN